MQERKKSNRKVWAKSLRSPYLLSCILRKHLVPHPISGANLSEIRNRRALRMTEYRNLAARVPRRGFSANTFPISERDAHLFGVPRHLFDQGWRMFERRSRILLIPSFDTCPSEKFPRIALSRRTSRCSCPTRVCSDKSADYREINGGAGCFCILVCVCVTRVNGVRYVLDDFKFHWCSNLMQIAELSGDNVVPREEVSARSALASSGAFRIRGVLKKGINRAYTLVIQFSRSNSEMLQYKWKLTYLLESDLNEHLFIF